MECTSIFNLHVDIWIVISKYLCPSDWKNLISTRNRELIGKLKSLKLDIRLDDHSLISMRVMSWFINAQSWFAYHLPLHLPSMRLLKTIKIKNNIKGWNYEQLHCIPYHCRSLQTIIIKSCPIILTDEWFNEYTFRLVVETKYVTPKALEVLKQKPIRLPAWDPMFAGEE